MSNLIAKLAVSLSLAITIAGASVAQENQESLGLEMEPALGKQSLEKIADGTATEGRSRLAPSSSVTWPVTVLGALTLGLAGFGTGVLVTRRNAAKSETAAPVSLWLDAEKLQNDLRDLEGELRQQQHSNEELNFDREQLQLMHADQLHELRGEKEALTRELHALRLRDHGADDNGQQELIDELRAEIEQLRGAEQELIAQPEIPDGIADDQDMHAQLQQYQQQINDLEDLLRETHSENELLEQLTVGKEAQLNALTETLAHRDEEFENAIKELNELRKKTDLLDEKDSQVTMLDQELSSLREEMNQLLGQTGQYKVLVPELETRLYHRQEQIGALELDLQATAQEASERDHDARQWQEKVQYLTNALTSSEEQIARLESDLAAALESKELSKRAPKLEELQQENLDLARKLKDVETDLEEATTQLDDLQEHRERVSEWESTVTSLQAEIRRKSSLIDSQADHLARSEKQIESLQVEMKDLRSQLVARGEEAQSLRDLLEQAGSVVASLRDEIGQDEHNETRLRLAQDPAQDPVGDHDNAVEPSDADIEALRFTARSRRDLGNSLETILNEERTALEQASRRVSSRDENVIALKNELSANRVAMLALQSRLNELGTSDGNGTMPTAMEPERVERELQQSMRVLEALRADLHKWRGRVKPLHEALLSRNERIHALEGEVAALRRAQGLDTTATDNEMVDEVAELLSRAKNGEEPEQERARTLNEMKEQWDRIVSLETELAETGARLARVLELDDVRCRQIESLEMARTAQVARLAELSAELSAQGVDPETLSLDPENSKVVDFGNRRPS